MLTVFQVISAVLFLLHSGFAIPPPGSENVLVVFDETNDGVDIAELNADLTSRGFNVELAKFVDHPVLIHYGEHVYDSVIVIPGKVKGLGKTLSSKHFLEYMQDGGNLMVLTTPNYNPQVIRDVANQLGFTIGTRGVSYQDDFKKNVSSIYNNILVESPGSLNGASAATIGDNELLLGLVEGSATSYSYNTLKQVENATLTDVFALGPANYLAVGLQTLHNSRFMWIGSPELLKGMAGRNLTSWVLQESNNLRLVKATHVNEQGESSLFYDVGELVEYCAQVEQWDPVDGAWRAYRNRADIQLEFRMLDPYYRMDLRKSGCVEFTTPDQYGLFTFALEYMRPGLSFLNDHQVVTVLQRANDAWPRSWTITNSWVYLGGVTTSIMGFLVFVVLYMASPDASKEVEAVKEKADTESSEQQTSSKPKAGKKRSEKNKS